LSPAQPSPIDRRDSGFTIIEVLVALAVVGVTIVAIGSVMSTNSRGVRLLEEHLALTQTAHTVMATAIPKRNELGPGRLSGELSQYRWQIDIGPVGGEWEVNDDRVSWIPELIKIRVRSPRGATVDLETVRLMMRPQR
jgi:general secretion pathway protein I